MGHQARDTLRSHCGVSYSMQRECTRWLGMKHVGTGRLLRNESLGSRVGSKSHGGQRSGFVSQR